MLNEQGTVAACTAAADVALSKQALLSREKTCLEAVAKVVLHTLHSEGTCAADSEEGKSKDTKPMRLGQIQSPSLRSKTQIQHHQTRTIDYKMP